MSPMSSAPGDRADSATQAPSAGEPTPAELASEQGVPARGASHYAKGTAANMVRSMAVIVAISLAFYFVAGRGHTRTAESVDVPGTARYHAEQAGHPFAYPEGLPEGWIATTVRYERSQDGVMAWNAGYTTPDEEYVSVRQGVDADEDWVEAQTHTERTVGELRTEDGRDWVKRDREDQVQRSLVHEPEGSEQLTTLVTGTGSWAQLEAFADRLVETNPPPGD